LFHAENTTFAHIQTQSSQMWRHLKDYACIYFLCVSTDCQCGWLVGWLDCLTLALVTHRTYMTEWWLFRKKSHMHVLHTIWQFKVQCSTHWTIRMPLPIRFVWFESFNLYQDLNHYKKINHFNFFYLCFIFFILLHLLTIL